MWYNGYVVADELVISHDGPLRGGEVDGDKP
jgi:hypothetical protein